MPSLTFPHICQTLSQKLGKQVIWNFFSSPAKDGYCTKQHLNTVLYRIFSKINELDKDTAAPKITEFFPGNSAISVKDNGLTNIKMYAERKAYPKGKIHQVSVVQQV